MTSSLENQLRESMQQGSVAASKDWGGIVQRAEQQQRRESVGLRAVVVGFVGLLAFALLSINASTTLDTVDPAAGDDLRQGTSGLTDPLLLAPVATTLVLLAMFAIGLARRIPSDAPRSGWSRYWMLLIVPPVGNALAASAIFLEVLGLWAGVAFKLATVLCVPILIGLLSGRIAERPTRWRTASATWIVLGVAIVLWTRRFIDTVVRVTNEPLGTFRLWPLDPDNAGFTDQSGVLASLDHPPDASWTPSNIAQLELVSVAILAVVSGLTVRSLRRTPWAAAAVLPLVSWFGLLAYNAFAPLGVVMDFDFFIGDLVLASALFELTIPFAPTDFVGAIAIALAAISMAVLLWFWGGPTRRTDDVRS